MEGGSAVKRFRKVYLEISNVCNLSCSFCPGTHRPGKRMTKEEFTWRTMDEELFLIYEGGATDSFFYSFDNSRLHLYDSENRHYGSYHKKRDCH